MQAILGEVANFGWTHPVAVFVACAILGVCKALSDRRTRLDADRRAAEQLERYFRASQNRQR